MNNRQGVILYVCLIAIILFIDGLTITGENYATITGHVTQVGASWQGGDLQTYQNLTVTVSGHSFQTVLYCNYYHLGSSIPVNVYTYNWWYFGNLFFTHPPEYYVEPVQGCL